jgi:hypothetical protein
MSDEQANAPIVSYVAVGLVAAAIAYLAAYGYSVEPSPFIFYSGPHIRGAIVDVPVRYGRPGFPLTDIAFSGHQDFWKRLFGPIHWADRKLRPTVWSRKIGELYMIPSRKKPGVAFWATVVVVVGMVAYPLGFGPACWITSRLRFGNSAVSVVYQPLLRIWWNHELGSE